MVKKAITKLLRQRHFWRHVSFDELSELYTSEFLRALAISVVGIFVPIYLYKLGYSLQAIIAMQVIWALFRPVFCYVAAKSIALLGPKHSMALGTVFQIVYLAVLVSLESVGWPLWLLGILGSLSYALFGIALQVDFSKVKHTEHGGKELGFLTICTRVGSFVGPIAGGLIASFYNPKATIILAILIMALSLVPLFKTAEPVKVKQKISLRGFPWKRHRRDFLSAPFLGIENIVSVMVWPLFAALAIFQKNTFAAIGLLTAGSTVIALIGIYLIGKRIDDQRGGALLKFGAIANAAIHLIRPFIGNAPQAFITSFVNEPITASYQMPFNKGLYDAADSVPGYRIVYLTLFDTFRMFGLLIFWVGAYIASFYVTSDITLLKSLFFVGAIASLGILIQRFPALKS